MMKRLLTAALAVVLTISLAACGDNNSANLPKPNVSGDNTILGSDFQKDMGQSTADHMQNVCKDENGYFFRYGDGNIYYLDKESGMSTVLCGKPECSHTNDTCNAYAYGNFLTYYNGKLYWSNSDYVDENGTIVNYGERLHRMNIDGTEHEVVQELDFEPGGDTSNFLTKPIIHRGIVYFAYSGRLYAVSLGADIENAVCIYGEEIVDDGSHIVNENELWYELWADGDLAYFMAKNVKQSDGTYKDILYSYDPQKEELTKVWEVPEKSEVGTWDTTGVSVSDWYVSGGHIYFYLCGNDLWFTELSTGKTAKLADIELEAGSAIFGSEYIVIMNKEIWGQQFGGGSALTGGDTLYVYNYSGELVKKISLSKVHEEYTDVSECQLLWIDAARCFFLANATVIVPNTTHTNLTYIMYSVDMKTGDVEKAGWSDEI